MCVMNVDYLILKIIEIDNCRVIIENIHNCRECVDIKITYN